jgi:uncharacterized protein with NRDE domain
MCLILFSYQPNTSMPLLLGANRDEFFARPTLPVNYWEDHPKVLAGKDQVAGGTWIGITKAGRFAAITNIREPSNNNPKHRPFNAEVSIKSPAPDTRFLKSRGELTRAFLTGTQSCEHYLKSIIEDPQDYQKSYAGFNLLVGEFTQTQQSLFYLNNREEGFQKLTAGIYGLSNHRLNTPWPKIINGKQALEDTIANNHQLSHLTDRNTVNSKTHQILRKILENPTLAADNTLPATGLSYESEKALSASFIKMPLYGTRTSTVITINRQTIEFSEQNYLADSSQASSDENMLVTKNSVKENLVTKSPVNKSPTKNIPDKNTHKNSGYNKFTLALY